MVAKPRTNRRRIAELAYVLRAILDDIRAGSGLELSAHGRALDLAAAFARGEKVAAKALRGASDAARAEKKDYGVHSPPYFKAVYWLPVETLLAMVKSGDDYADLVATHANYAVPDADWGARTKRIDALMAEARAHAANIDDTPLEPKPRRVNARAADEEGGLLARSRGALSGASRELFDSIRPARDRKRTSDAKTLKRLLAQHDLPSAEPILEFEDAFGGLLLPTSNFDSYREDGLYVLIGPYAVLTSGFTYLPRGGKLGETKPLVPVALGPNEDVYFLDVEGRPYYHETIAEPSAVPFGADGAELVTRLILGVLTYEGNAWGGSRLSVTLDRVPRVVERLELRPRIEDEEFKAWASADAVLVVFRTMVFGVARTDEALRRARE